MRLLISPSRGITSTVLLITFILAHSLWASPLLGPRPTAEMTQKMSMAPFDKILKGTIVPRRPGQSSFTWLMPENGWKVKFLRTDLPVPNDLGVAGLKTFYTGLLVKIDSGEPESTIIAASQETVHLGSRGGLWLNIRSVNKVLSRTAITEILDALVRCAQRGWAPLFTAE